MTYLKAAAIPSFLNAFMKRSQKSHRNLIIMVIFLAMGVSVGAQVLHFYWQLTENQPNPDSMNKTKVSESEAKINVEDFELIFGFSDQQTNHSNSEKNIPITRMNLTLRGIVANPDNIEHDSAIIQSSNQDKLYVPGDTLPGGATLDRVHSDHVIIKRGNQLEKLYFPEATRDSRALQEFRPTLDETPVPEESQHDIRNYPDDMSLEERMQEIRERLQEAGQE